MKIPTTNQFRIIIIVLVALTLPLFPMFVQRTSSILIIILFGLFPAAIYLRNRWRSSKHTGQFLGYYLRLVAVAVAIVVAFWLLFFGIVLLLR